MGKGHMPVAITTHEDPEQRSSNGEEKQYLKLHLRMLVSLLSILTKLFGSYPYKPD